jgi:hypothetical protein
VPGGVIFAVGLDLLDIVWACLLVVEDGDDYHRWGPGRYLFNIFRACLVRRECIAEYEVDRQGPENNVAAQLVQLPPSI